MKLYFAGMVDTRLMTPEMNILLSYADQKLVDKSNRKIFLDSGAFAVFTRGITIEIDDYIKYIKHNKEKFEVYSVLDVIGSWEKTRENLEHMEAKGLEPIPTFHYGSPGEELARLCETHDYIALGGLVPMARNKKQTYAWLDYCFSIIKDKAKVHGFGVTGHVLLRYPFYSVDSTSWLQCCAYKKAVKHTNGKITQRGKGYYDHYNHMNARQMILGDEALNKQIVGEFLELEKYITRLWEKRGIVWED